MWRFHSYFEAAGEAQGIKRAVKPTTESLNVFRQGYELLLVVSGFYRDPHYFTPALKSQGNYSYLLISFVS